MLLDTEPDSVHASVQSVKIREATSTYISKIEKDQKLIRRRIETGVKLEEIKEEAIKREDYTGRIRPRNMRITVD